MNRWIVAALLVPAVAIAGPKKKPRGKKAAPVEKKDTTETETEATTPAPTPATTPAVTPTVPAAGSGSAAPSTVPASAPPTTPTATPAPAPATTEPPPADEKSVDVDTLRQEYLSLRDELFKSRARANAVASQLYSTRMTIKFSWGSARYYGVSKASIRLDGATVYEDATGAIATDDGVRFDGYVAPGRHLVTFHVEATGKDDDSFTSVTESQVVVKAVANKDLVVSAKGKDSGDIAYEWKRSEKGSYGLGIDVSVRSVANGAAAKGAK